MNVESFMVWNIMAARMFSVAESLRFGVIVSSLNGKLRIKRDPETVRVFLNNLAKEGYLTKGKSEGEAVYTKTPKMKRLFADILGFARMR